VKKEIERLVEREKMTEKDRDREIERMIMVDRLRE